MKSKSFFLVFCSFTLFLNGAEILRNADFSKLKTDGSPEEWELRGNASDFKKESDGSVVLTMTDKPVMLIQNRLAVNPGTEYVFLFDAKAPRGTDFTVYFEEFVDGNWRNPGTKCRPGGKGMWQPGLVRFAPSTKAKRNRLLIRLLNKNATLQIKNLRILSAAEYREADHSIKTETASIPNNAEILRNADFSKLKADGTPEEWEFRGNASDFKKGSDGSIVLTMTDKPVMLILNRLAVNPGTEYVFLFDAKAPRGTDFTVYFEEFVDGDWQNPGTKCRPGGKGQWQPCSIQFSASAKAKRNRLLIRLLNKNATLQIKNLRIIPADQYQNHGIYEMDDGGTRYVLINGNFERGNSNWQVSGEARSRKTVGNFGNWGLYLPTRGSSAVQSNVMLAPGKKWRLTFFAGSDSKADAQFRMLAMDRSSKKKFNDVVLTAHPGEYQRFEFQFELDGDKAVPVSFYCVNASSEPLLVDELYLDEVIPENPLQIELTAPAYRNRIYSSLPQKSVSGQVSCPNAAEFEIRFNGKTLRQKGNPALFEFPAEPLGIGKHILSAEAFSAEGKKIASSETAIHKMPPKPNEVTIDADNNLRVNGKRIFPMAMFLSGPDILKYAAARNGINVMHDQGWVGDENGALALLDKAKEFGLFLKLKLAGFHEMKNDPDFQNKWRDHVRKILTPAVINHPALLFYDYSDEGIGNDAPDRLYKAALEVMDEVDPYHPVSKCESPRGTVLEYLRKHSRYTHLHGMDIYPIPESVCHSGLADKSLASVGAYAELYRQAVYGKKPVKLVLQAFDWGKLTRKQATGIPSEAELRFMIFDALLHGVKDIEFYNDGTEDQNFYNYFFRCINELYHWEKIVNTGTAVSGFSAGAEPLFARGYSLNGKNYYAVLNRSAKPAECRLSGLAGPAWNLHARKQQIHNGDKLVLPPFGTLLLSESGTLPEGEWQLMKPDPEKEKGLSDLFGPGKREVMAKLGQADWIWYPGETRRNHSKVIAAKEFTLNGLPSEAVWYLTADDGFQAKINGREVLAGTRWTRIYTRNVTSFLRPGKNMLEITGVNNTGSCGLIAQLKLVYPDGKTEVIATDKTWTVTNSEKHTSPAHVIGRFGKPGTWTWMRIK